MYLISMQRVFCEILAFLVSNTICLLIDLKSHLYWKTGALLIFYILSARLTRVFDTQMTVKARGPLVELCVTSSGSP